MNILILGASYGSLLGTKIALAGHNVRLVCLPPESEAINRHGVQLRLPVRGREQPVEINSRDLPGRVSAGPPDSINPDQYDLVALAMQEPQYRVAEIRALLRRIAAAGIPCMSIMNMPPLPYLKRIPELDTAALRDCYTDATVWNGFDPDRFTLCSPDPQAFRPPDEPVNVLQVSLPTNFKAARFSSESDTEILRRLERDIASTVWPVNGEDIVLPVKLKVHESLFVPMAKWAMLLTGNYRCVETDGIRSIRDAVHSNPDQSRQVYEWVCSVCVSLGADTADMVPFEKYARAAEVLLQPSSAARALDAGARFIERVDLLVQQIAAGMGMGRIEIDETVTTVNNRLERNREAV